MPSTRAFIDHVADQLARFGPVEIKRMFSGAGLFRGGRMFALIAGDVLYFKVGDSNRAAYDAAGAKPFNYTRKGGVAQLTSYYEVPAHVFDDPEELVAWAKAAHEAAMIFAAKPRKRRETKVHHEDTKARRRNK